MGYCGIRPHDELPEIEIGWHTKKTYWNQRLTTEAALACRSLAFDRYALDRLIGIIDPQNLPSIRVAEKIGMRRRGRPCSRVISVPRSPTQSSGTSPYKMVGGTGFEPVTSAV